VVSFTPTTLSCSRASVAIVSGATSTAEDRRADRDVVDDDRQVGELARDRRVPLAQGRLGRARVVGRHHERGVGAHALRGGGELERLVDAGAARARQEGHAIVDRRRGGLHDRDALGDRLRGRLAGRAADRDAVRAVVELPLHEPRDGGQVDGAVGVEGGHQRRDRAPDRRGI
jgi:hypothetical protein